MKIKDISLSAAYVGQRVVKAIAVGAQEIWSAVKYIVFKDPVVEQICATNWGDGVGITEEQAAAVTSIGTKFSRNTEIESFDELKKFTNIKSTPKDSFYTCTNLRTISIPSSVTDILWSSFNGCTKLVNVDIPDDSQIKIIDQWAFNGCSMLKGLNIPQGVTTIRSEAFKGCSSLDMTLPSDLTTIGTSAFANCGITEAVIPSGVESISMGAFTGCQSLKTVTIQEGTLRTEFDSFYNCQALITVYIPSSLDTLGESTFNYNINLRTVTFADNSQLTTISARVFLECYSLTSITIPNNVNNIGDRAFLSCRQLKNVIMMPIAPPTLGMYVFNGTSSDLSIYVPDQSVQAYREASVWSSYADKIWPMEAYLYGIITFADPAVEAICLANWDTNGSGYLSKEEAKAVTDIGEVFKDNTEITSFDEFAEFTGISSIAKSAFANCENLREISIPIVNDLGPACFYYCSRLINIYMHNDTPPYVGYSVFDGARDAVVYVPDDSIEAYKNADTWKAHARRVLGMSDRDRLITDNYTKNTGQSYGNVGGNITFTTDITFEWAKIPIGEVEAVVIRSTDAIPSSLIQYVDSNGKILHRDATDNPYAVSRYVIANIEGATHVYVSSAAGTMRIYGKP